MMDRWGFSAVDRTLQDVCGSGEFFGGKLVIASGDFRQILPVLPKEPDYVVIGRTIKSANFWEKVKLTYY